MITIRNEATDRSNLRLRSQKTKTRARFSRTSSGRQRWDWSKPASFCSWSVAGMIDWRCSRWLWCDINDFQAGRYSDYCAAGSSGYHLQHDATLSRARLGLISRGFLHTVPRIERVCLRLTDCVIGDNACCHAAFRFFFSCAREPASFPHKNDRPS